MTSKHNAPYATTAKPKYSIGLEVYSKTTRRYETIYGVRALKSSDGLIKFYYCFSPCALVEEVWHSEELISMIEPYVRDRLGYCICLGDTVSDTHGQSGDFVVSKIDTKAQRCFLRGFASDKNTY